MGLIQITILIQVDQIQFLLQDQHILHVEVVKDNNQVLHLFLVQVQQEVQVVEIIILEMLVCVDKVFLVVE